MNILKKISLRNLKLNKKRSIATVMGIVLSTALMIGIGLLFSSLKETMVQEVINSSGSHHAIIYDLTKEEINKLKQNDIIKNIKTTQVMGSGEIDELTVYNLVGVSKEFLTQLELIKGRMPINTNEVVIYEPYQNTENIKYNDALKLKMGEVNTECLLTLKTPAELKELQVVGVVKKEYIISSYCGETLITVEAEGPYNAYIEYNSVKDARSKTRILATSLGIEDPDSRIKFNTALLEVNGESKFDNFDAVVASLMAIALTIISIGCTIVIYNSFAISIIERKRQFGLLNSIGATKKQIKKSVYFESFIIGTIGIVIGTISAFIGIGAVILIANNLLSGIMESQFRLVVYPLYIIIPIVFMVIVIIASASIPALIASRLSPIDSIKMKDDIKIKAKKLKVNGLVKKLFGFEATIAFKNMKRNKRKYRITILALFVSITMFIVFSSYMDYMLKSQEMSGINKPYDILVEYADSELKYNEIFNVINENKPEKVVVKKQRYATLAEKSGNKIYNNDYLTAIGIAEQDKDEYFPNFTIMELDSKSYNALLKKYNKKPGAVFVYNYFELMDMNTNNLKISSGKKIKEAEMLELSMPKDEVFKEEININIEKPTYINERIDDIADLGAYGVFVIVPSDIYTNFANQIDSKVSSESLEYVKNDNYTITIYTDKHKETMADLKDATTDLGVNLYAYNITEEIGILQKAMLLFKILLYGFVGLIASIGVTSVFNTLNTSIILRRREFAMLRSVGLSPQGFNKMIIFETLIFTVKSLLYSIPFSLFIVFQIHNSISNVVTMNTILIPYKAIIISSIMVLIIVFTTIMYSTRTIKKANILESLKDENI